MIARTRKTKTSSNEDALAAFVQKKAEIDAMLAGSRRSATITSTYRPDEVTWGHVGTLELLRRAAEADHRHGLQRGRARRIGEPISAHAPRGTSRRGSRS